MKIPIEKRRTAIAVGLVILAIGCLPFAYYLFSPSFPESVPSPGNKQQDDTIHRGQTDFFNRFTSYIRLNHAGILEAEAINYDDQTSEKEVRFVQRYKSIQDDLLIKLIRSFSQDEKIGYKIKKFSYKNKELNKPDSYEVVFYQNSDPWVSVKMEWADESLYQEKHPKIQYTEDSEHLYKDQEPSETAKPDEGPKLVIVIDDLGNNMDVFNDLIKLEFEITYAILPQQPFSISTAEIVNKAGYDIMLHLPMQPKEWPKYNPGKGALFLSDSEELVQNKMEANFRSVPYIIGVNNHMGSAYTQYQEGLDTLMKILNSRELFFMDSKTAPGQLAKNTAAKNKVRYFSRNIFLDNQQNEEYVKGQLYKAVAIARKSGQAIAIGHPYRATYQVLASQLPLLEESGIKIAGVRSLLVN